MYSRGGRSYNTFVVLSSAFAPSGPTGMAPAADRDLFDVVSIHVLSMPRTSLCLPCLSMRAFHSQPAPFSGMFSQFTSSRRPSNSSNSGPIPCFARLPAIPARTLESSGVNNTANGKSDSITERKRDTHAIEARGIVNIIKRGGINE